jgi:adenylate kinase family enzyme
MNVDIVKLRSALSNTYWLSGMSTSGKSTTARILAKKHGFVVQARDDWIKDHWKRMTPVKYPAMCYMKDLLGGSERVWKESIEEPVEKAVDRLWQFFVEDFTLTVEDLWTSMADFADSNHQILIEGQRLPPEGVVELLSNHRRAVWIAPSHAAFENRLQTSWRQMSERFPNPADGRRRLADVFHAGSEKFADTAGAIGLTVIRTDVGDTPEKVASLVATAYSL